MITTMRTWTARDVLERAGWPIAVVVLALGAGKVVGDPWVLRLAFALALAACVVAAGLRSPRGLVTTALLWAIPLAMLRRLLNSTNSGGGTPDPLLLVLPLMLIVSVAGAHAHGAFARLSPLARTVLAFMGLILLGAFNPEQGSILTGVSSLIFYVPLFAFWIGRSVVDDRLLRRLFAIVAFLAVPCALYGIGQVLIGLPSWDKRWVESLGQTSLLVSGALRPFANFSSSAEFGMFLAIATLTWLVMRPARIPLVVRLAPVALLIAGIVLVSSRGLFVVLAIALGVVIGARRGLPLLPTMVIGLVLVLALPWVVSQVAPTTYSQSSASVLIQHDVEGLANPLDPSTSTAGIHLSLMMHGIGSAFRNPAGLGAGAVTIAGSKFGGVAAGTEADPSNAAVALGLPGLVAYAFLLVFALRAVYSVAVRRRDSTSLLALAVVIVTVLQWFNGGQYSVAFLPWLVLGWADAQQIAREQ